jgi:hypothetical protein
MDNEGNIQRVTSASVDSSLVLLIATAVTNPGETAWDEFLDFRKHHVHPDKPRSLVVGEGANTDFKTLPAAIKYLEQNGGQSVAEILISGQLDMTNGEAPIKIDFQYLGVASSEDNLRSLIIRGVDENSGIKWGQDSDLFRITGLAAENAATAAGQKASIRFHNLLFDNTNGVGPSNTALFRFDNSYFTEVSIDNCRSQSNSVFGWNRAVAIGCHIDVLTIAENTFEVRGLGASNGAIVVNDGSGRIVKNGYIFRNTVRADLFGSSVDTRGIVIGATNEKIWVTENSIDNGRDGNQSFAKGIEIQPFNPTAKVPAGARWVVDNVLGNTQINNVVLNFAIEVETNFGVGSPVYIIGNTIYDSWSYGVVSFFNQADLKVLDNDIDVRLGGMEIAGQAVIANNRVNIQAGTSSAGIYAYEGNTVISGNVVTGVGEDGIFIGDGGSVSGMAVIIGNSVNGAWSLDGIRTRRSNSSIVGNIVNNTHASGEGIYINGFDDVLCTGNHATANSNAFRLGLGSSNCVVTGNRGESIAGTALLLEGDRHVVTGNYMRCLAELDLGPVASIRAKNSAISGNYFGARINADYGNGGNGMRAMEVHGLADGCAFSGNVLENRGNHTDKATLVILVNSANHCFVGNVIKNNAVGAIFSTNAGLSVVFGSAGVALPGANSQSIL